MLGINALISKPILNIIVIFLLYWSWYVETRKFYQLNYIFVKETIESVAFIMLVFIDRVGGKR